MDALRKLWPRSLAVRLSVLLIATLATAQLGLALLLSHERDSIVEELLHGQAFNQAVTLARLLNTRDGAEDDILASFQSRRSCASVGTSAPSGTMSAAEAQLALTLRGMLHGNDGGAPSVWITAAGDSRASCGPLPAPREGADDESEHDDDDDDDRSAMLVMDLPLLDGRWLHYATAIDLSTETGGGFGLVTFLVSSLAVALVTIWVVRSQTASLRALADASDRFGKGETLAPLPIRGPSEVDRATEAFNTMQARLGQYMRDRMQLLAGISHDLRTPLTTLRLKAEFIEDEAVRDDLVATIDELTAICNATIEFTRAESVTEATTTVDLAALAGDLVAEFQLAKADVEATLLEPLRLACRPVSLKRALRNLIENAVRYGRRARISVAAEGDRAVIRVDDEGPGIPPEQMTEMFKPFVRLDASRSTDTGGLGLGLAIAQGIVQAHGGTLTLANRPEGGLRAEVRLELG